MLIVAGPYVSSTGTCRWCGQLLSRDDAGAWVAERGGALCRPFDRGATCQLSYYLRFGIEPLRLLIHDGLCSCQRSISHHPATSTPYPYPDRVPFHCAEPMALSPSAWACRSRPCTYTLPTANDEEVRP